MSKKRQKQKRPVKHHTKDVTVIHYSCVTGHAVWIYQGTSKDAAYRQYYRVVQAERKRMRQWRSWQRKWSGNIIRLMDECIASLPIVGTLTRAQRDAIRKLRAMADNPPEFVSPLLEHDRERRHQHRLKVRRQRYWHDADLRQRNKERLRKRRQQQKAASEL